MLKIKDNVDLRKLKKIGFHEEEDCISRKMFAYKRYSMRIWLKDRHISIADAHFDEIELDLLYDLIKDGLVEKVD